MMATADGLTEAYRLVIRFMIARRTPGAGAVAARLEQQIRELVSWHDVASAQVVLMDLMLMTFDVRAGEDFTAAWLVGARDNPPHLIECGPAEDPNDSSPGE